jgi:hypothetical protein
MVMMSGLASCTASQNDEDLTDTTSVFRSAMDIYGVEYASDNIFDKNNIPSILAEDMCAVLETLRLNSNTQQNCIRTSDNSYEKVIMNGTYQAVTRSSGNEDFALSVALKFSIEKGQVYYWGTDYSYSSGLFDWSAQGLSLSPQKDADGYTYEFESETFLYFKVSDEADTIVRVPVVFRGSYNFRTEQGQYYFKLLKYSR